MEGVKDLAIIGASLIVDRPVGGIFAAVSQVQLVQKPL